MRKAMVLDMLNIVEEGDSIIDCDSTEEVSVIVERWR